MKYLIEINNIKFCLKNVFEKVDFGGIFVIVFARDRWKVPRQAGCFKNDRGFVIYISNLNFKNNVSCQLSAFGVN